MELYTAVGPGIVRRIQDLGGSVFVDLKFHDIPNTVASAGRVMTRLGCAMFTTHAAGGTRMLTALTQAVREEADTLGVQPPLVLAVAVLTSIDQRILEDDVPVSYTHLDVYKRQMMWKPGFNGSGATPVIFEKTTPPSPLSMMT